VSIVVTVPATTANLGPGFDCLGAALTLYNRFTFSQSSGGDREIVARGVDADRLSTDDSNLLYRAFLKLYQHLDKTPPPTRIEIELAVPLARGLGSSATAIVGGLVGANAIAGSPLSDREVLQLAIEMEGHPDNVVPAFLGGCRLSVFDETWTICELSWHSNIVPVVAIPNFELSTAEARKVLPDRYDRADVIFNSSRLALLLRGLETGNGDWLRIGSGDRVHQPYRQSLIKGYDAVFQAALDAGAYNLTISGAGPTLIALSPSAASETVAVAMAEAWENEGVTAQARWLQVDREGVRVD